jgi:hypothetical protein
MNARKYLGIILPAFFFILLQFMDFVEIESILLEVGILVLLTTHLWDIVSNKVE